MTPTSAQAAGPGLSLIAVTAGPVMSEESTKKVEACKKEGLEAVIAVVGARGLSILSNERILANFKEADESSPNVDFIARTRDRRPVASHD